MATITKPSTDYDLTCDGSAVVSPQNVLSICACLTAPDGSVQRRQLTVNVTGTAVSRDDGTVLTGLSTQLADVKAKREALQASVAALIDAAGAQLL